MKISKRRSKERKKKKKKEEGKEMVDFSSIMSLFWEIYNEFIY